MNQIKEYKESNFKQDYFHYAYNNTYYVKSTLLSDAKEFSKENNDVNHSINIPFKMAVKKLGKPNWVHPDYNWVSYWIFEFNSNTFYYMNDSDPIKGKGSTIGIFCKKKDTSRNWLFEPEEYTYQGSEELGKKLLAFVKELSDELIG